MSLKDSVKKLKRSAGTVKEEIQGTRTGVQETLRTVRPEILPQRPTFFLREPLIKKVRRLRGRGPVTPEE